MNTGECCDVQKERVAIMACCLRWVLLPILGSFVVLGCSCGTERGYAAPTESLALEASMAPSSVTKGDLCVLKVRRVNNTERKKKVLPLSISFGTLRILHKSPSENKFSMLYDATADRKATVLPTRTLRPGEAITKFQVIWSTRGGFVFSELGEHLFKIKVDSDYDRRQWDGATELAVKSAKGEGVPAEIADRKPEQLGGLSYELLPLGIWTTDEHVRNIKKERSKNWLIEVAAKATGSGVGVLLKQNLALRKAAASDKNVRRQISRSLQKIRDKLGQVPYEGALLNLSEWASRAEQFKLKKELLEKLASHNPNAVNIDRRVKTARKEVEKMKKVESRD
jgi:hypothetical protein